MRSIRFFGFGRRATAKHSCAVRSSEADVTASMRAELTCSREASRQKQLELCQELWTGYGRVTHIDSNERMKRKTQLCAQA